MESVVVKGTSSIWRKKLDFTTLDDRRRRLRSNRNIRPEAGRADHLKDQDLCLGERWAPDISSRDTSAFADIWSAANGTRLISSSTPLCRTLFASEIL